MNATGERAPLLATTLCENVGANGMQPLELAVSIMNECPTLEMNCVVLPTRITLNGRAIGINPPTRTIIRGVYTLPMADTLLVLRTLVEEQIKGEGSTEINRPADFLYECGAQWMLRVAGVMGERASDAAFWKTVMPSTHLTILHSTYPIHTRLLKLVASHPNALSAKKSLAVLHRACNSDWDALADMLGRIWRHGLCFEKCYSTLVRDVCERCSIKTNHRQSPYNVELKVDANANSKSMLRSDAIILLTRLLFHAPDRMHLRQIIRAGNNPPPVLEVVSPYMHNKYLATLYN